MILLLKLNKILFVFYFRTRFIRIIRRRKINRDYENNKKNKVRES
jgi:hypothetical protein